MVLDRSAGDPADSALIDRMVDLIEAGDSAAGELAALYEEQGALRLPID